MVAAAGLPPPLLPLLPPLLAATAANRGCRLLPLLPVLLQSFTRADYGATARPPALLIVHTGEMILLQGTLQMPAV